MEAHTGTIGIEISVKPRRSRLAQIRGAIRQRRLQRAERSYSMRASGPAVRSVPGSDHTHLIRRPRGF